MNNPYCPNCKEDVSQIEFECSNCGFPLSGTEKERSIFIGKQIANKSKIGDAKDSQNRVQKILWLIAAFQCWNAYQVYEVYNSIIDAMFYIVLAILLAVLGFLSPKKPILFISIALLVMLAYYLLLYLTNPIYLYSGAAWKIAIIATLIYGLVHSLEEQKLKKKYNFLKDN